MLPNGLQLRDLPLLAYSLGRSLQHSVELRAMNGLVSLVPGVKALSASQDREIDAYMRQELLNFLAEDIANIRRREYPASVLRPESPLKHWGRLPHVFMDTLRIARKRAKASSQEFSARTQDLLKDLPRYYQRNFHFQTDGYLSDASAENYERQVEMLFAGTADAMRRLIIPPLKQHLKERPAPRILELACGRGTATRFVRQALPGARLIGVDLSAVYLKHARERFRGDMQTEFLQADAGRLPFKEGEFDAVYSVFLFHELPLPERERVIREMRRVTKAGAFVGMVDSIQRGDVPQMDAQLWKFPQDFHEPYFRNYTEHAMEDLFTEQSIEAERKIAFLSKAVWGTRLA